MLTRLAETAGAALARLETEGLRRKVAELEQELGRAEPRAAAKATG